MVLRLPRDRVGIGAVDYALMGAGSALAAYSIGMGLRNPSLGIVLSLLVFGGTAASYLIRLALGRSPILKFDGILYTAAAIVAFLFLVLPVNPLLPEEGFPLDRELIVAGRVSWVLVVGSFFAWRDATLLFQAIPCIALFGLVGCYDTFREVIYAFFGFLVCLCTLFARARSREALHQAAASGYFGHEIAVHGLPDQPVDQLERIQTGPWRWLAGPGWALGSALAVVLVSFIGAPVIEESVKGISGVVKVNLPRSLARRPPSIVNRSEQGSVRIGRGPINLLDTQLYEAKLDRLRYLRTAVYDVYDDGRWRPAFGPPASPGSDGSFDGTVSKGRIIADASVAAIEPSRRVSFRYEIRPLVPTRILPVPGDVREIARRGLVRRRPDGQLELTGDTEKTAFRAEPVVARDAQGARHAVRDLPEVFRDTRGLKGIDPRVVALAAEAASNAGTDYQKARAIKRVIEGRAMYNINADRTPLNEDPVAYFHFAGKEGYCDLFASSMVLMARAQGIPARYATGYLPDPRRTLSDGSQVVVEADAHAWAELFFEGSVGSSSTRRKGQTPFPAAVAAPLPTILHGTSGRGADRTRHPHRPGCPWRPHSRGEGRAGGP